MSHLMCYFVEVENTVTFEVVDPVKADAALTRYRKQHGEQQTVKTFLEYCAKEIHKDGGPYRLILDAGIFNFNEPEQGQLYEALIKYDTGIRVKYNHKQPTTVLSTNYQPRNFSDPYIK